MKWKQKDPLYYGAVRIVGRFLWFPKCLDYEWRWLELVRIQQEVGYVKRFWEVGATENGWIDKHWIDPDQILEPN